MAQHTTQSIADHVGGQLAGPGDLPVTGLAEMSTAAPGDLTFIGDAKFADAWPGSQATAALVNQDIELEPGDGRALIVVNNADLAMAKVLDLFVDPADAAQPGIHPTAVVEPTATIGDGVHIGAHVYVGNHAVVGDHCTLLPGVVIGSRCTLGHHCTVHANAVVGADGFGYRPGDTSAGQPPIVKVPHIGTVRIADHVEIGANTCIDRGKFDATTIGPHTKIDNLVQIAHNCHIGACVVIAGCTGIAGSTTVGDGTQIGGSASIRDHVTIGKGVSLAACASVMGDIPDGETWGGEPAQPLKDRIRQEIALRKLPELMKEYRKLKRGS